MLPIKKIICPTDFSEPSYEGVAAACEVASHFGAEMVLAYVMSPIPLIPTPDGAAILNVPTYQQEMENYARDSLDEVVKGRIPAGIRSRIRVLVGDPADRIVALAGEEKADIIIMATHGEKGWRRFISGSVTERVVRLADCPVLTIHPPAGSQP